MEKKTITGWLIALAFGILSATAGWFAGGRPFWVVVTSALAVAAYAAFKWQGWMLRASEMHWGRSAAVASVFSLLAITFVAVTGGATSPLFCFLYLPVLLATLCYGIRLVLLTSLGMAASGAFFALGGLSLPYALSGPNIALGLSFPLVAIFGGVLRAQMEEHFRTLDTEKQDLSALLEDQSALLDMSQMMDSADDLEMTLNLILLNVQRQTDCQVCAVYLKAADGRTLELRAASGLQNPAALLPVLTVEEAQGGKWSLAETYHDDLSVHAFYAAEADAVAPKKDSRLFAIDPTAQSFACLPLASAMELLGMLYVGYAQPGGLTLEGVHRVEQLAERAAFPLQRLLHQQDFRSLAYSDSMTGLDNFRQFEENLRDEMARAERYDRVLSVILLDIDHFKSFNDTLGHQAGDALLGQLGVVLRNSLRNVDKPARYGGEEFVIICPETGPEEACLIAERIRRNVADTSFVLPNIEPEKSGKDGQRAGETVHVTVSLGCATFPRDARTARDLVKKADIALYAAKEAGRNAVRAFEEEGSRMKVA